MMNELAHVKIQDVVDHGLRWVQPKALTSGYELRAGEDVVARLDFRSLFGSLATGKSADGCWTFKRLGFLKTRVTVRACDSDQDMAVFHNSTWSGGGTLQLPDGRKFPANVNFWQTRYELRNESEQLLVTFRRATGVLHLSSEVVVHGEAARMPELPWLVMLGWYLTVMLHHDSAAV